MSAANLPDMVVRMIKRLKLPHYPKTLSMEEILVFLCQIYPLSPECNNYLRSVARFQKVAKNELILRIGEISRKLYFIKSGALHCFYYVKNKQVSDWFFWENETVVSIGSYYDQVPSEDCIVALEESQLYYITKEHYDYACLHF